MSPHTSTPDLTPFVPDLAIELGRTPGSHWTSVEGSMLSADISGFTALSERLATKGKAGAEEITELINTCFTALIDACQAYGGDVLKFGGDAVLVLFRGDDHRLRCGSAALAMQQALANSAAARRSSLTMTVGAAEGPFDVFLVGEPRRELLISGANATEVIRLEASADKGATLMTPAIAGDIHRRMTDVGLGGFAFRSAPIARDIADDSNLARYIPGSVIDQLSAFSDMGGEHRLVTVGFVMIGGVDELITTDGVDAVSVHLTELVNAVRDACLTYQVTFLHSDIAPDGAKLILAAGAPLTSGNDEDAMLRAALAIAGHHSPFVIKVGVQRGRVYAGFLGAPYRRSYTVMGDPVNTAARLLGKAGPGDVIAASEIYRSTRSVFTADELEPFLVKGKIEPLTAFRVTAATDDVRLGTTTHLTVGRNAELSLLRRAVTTRGRVVEIAGAAGSGKSHLLQSAVEFAGGGYRIHRLTCSHYGTTTPYSAYTAMLRRIADIPRHASDDDAGRLLAAVVAEKGPELSPRLPLLAAAFGAEVPSTPESDAIDPDYWPTRVHDTVIDFLDTTTGGSALFVIEDLHWMDEASRELTQELVRAVRQRPWTIVLSRRPDGQAIDSQLDHVESVDLQPLRDEEIRSIAIAASDRSLSDAELDAIVGRAQGNPLFARELAAAISAGGIAQLPNTVEQLVSSRIDGLSPETRLVLRIASVLGTSMSGRDLQHILDLEQTGARLEQLDTDGIFAQSAGGRWEFSNSLYRDATYEGLPFRQRRRLHHVVGEALERAAEDPDDIASLLSQHFSIARVHDKAWHYSVLSGDDAARQRATAEAAASFERAMLSARHLRSGSAEIARVAESLGDAYFLLARFADAGKSFETARRRADDLVAEIRLTRKLGSVAERTGDTTRAIRWYRKATRLAESTAPTTDILAAGAEAALAEAGIKHRSGDQTECYRLASEARRQARIAGDRGVEALALERMHLALTYLRRDNADDVGHQALEIYRELDDNSGTLRTLINLGIGAYFGDDWTTASTYYLEATEAGRAASSIVLAETAALNSAEILSDQGHWDRANELFEAARRNWEAVGYPVGVAAATLFLAVGQTRAGLLGAARHSLDDARVRLEALGIAELIEDLRSRELEWILRSGTDPVPGARALLAELGADHPLAARIHRTLGLGLILSGDTDGARDALIVSLERAGAGTYEAALTSHALSIALASDPDAETWARAAAATFERLDVIAPPPLPSITAAATRAR
jgi:class 3 adenylate cyclase/tetratricopeptide (TPR) repeat protein